MAAFSSTQSTRRCATAQCCGRRDGADFPGAARACLERHQNSDISDAYSACGIRARIAGARLSLSVMAICTGLRLPARQSGGWIRRAEDAARILYALPGSVRHIPFSGSQRFPRHWAADRRRRCEHDRQLQRTMGAMLPGGGFLEPITAPNIVRAIYFNGITQDPTTYNVDPAT